MKKSVVKLFQNFLLIGASILCGLAFYSCGEDAGLGGAIDTKAPTLSIDYPKESGSAIRDSFILAGTVSDDKSISRVAVNVKSLDDGGQISETYSASFDSVKNRWWVDINKYEKIDDNHGSWKYPDGNYEFSVTAFDNAGNNSGTYSKTFEIDNTPPVFIISNPGVIKKTDLSPSAYGSLFTIDGTISDNHTISFMDVKIYDASGKCVSSETYEGENLPFYREEDIATAGGTSVQIAQYANASEENRSALNARYSQLHESDSGTEYYYAEIKLTDSTKVYQDPWGEDARSADEISADQLGNSTSTVYLYDDVYASLMSAKKGLGLSAANLKDIISGVYTGSANKDEVLKVLNDKAYDTSLVEDDPMANKLSFSLNPEANPTYNVNGFDFGFNADDAVQSASTGNTVSVTISAGLDGTNIAPEIVRVWMKEYKDRPTDAESIKADLRALEKQVETLEKSETEFLDALHKSETAAATTVKTGDSDWVLIYDYSLNNSKGSSVSTKTFSVTLPEGIKLSKYYILGVTGYDIEDVEFAQNSVYGFEGNTAGVPPTLKVETPANLSVWGDFEKPQFSGTATISSKSLYLTELTATLSIQDETTNATEGEFTDTITCKIENDKQTWELSEAGALTWDSANEKWNLDITKLPGLVELYNTKAKTAAGVYWLATLKISGKSSSGHEGESSQSIHIDTVAPKVSLASVTPSVSGSDYFGGTDTNTYLNGTVTVKGNIDEQNMADSDDAVSYDILAATGDDEPVSILSELIAHADELGVAFDGKIGKVVSINIPFNTKVISEFFHAFKGAAEDEKIKIEVKVTVKDKAGNLGTYSSNSLNDGKYFIIYQETDRPKIELGNADSAIVKADDVKINHNLFGTTSNNKLTISFSDDDSIAEYEVSVYNDKGELLPNANVSAQGENTPKANPYTFKPKKTTASLSYILPSEEAKYQIEIKAHDEFYLPATSLSSPNPYGEKIVEKFFVAVDSGAPEVEISKPAVGSFQSGSVQIEGSVSKAVDLEGTLTKTGSTKPEDTKKFSLKSTQMTKDGKSYNWTLPADVAEDGEYSIDVKVTDIYGQTAGKSRTFKVDTKSPEIKSATTSVDSANGLVPLDEMEYITLRTDVTDGAESKSVAGVSVVKYYLTKEKFTADQLKTENISQIKTAFDGTNWTQMNQGSTNDENVTSFNASVPVKTFATEGNGLYEGKAYLYVATEDNVGNFAIKAEPVVLNLDKSAPVIIVKDFDGTTEVEANGIAKATEPTQTFSVNVEDTNADLLTVNDDTLSVGGATTIAGGKGKSFVITPKWQGFDVNGSTKYEDTKTATFTGKDTYSRATSKTVILKCDTYAPRVVLNRASGDTFSNSSSIELKGTVEDKNISGTSEYFKIYLVPPASTSFETKEGLVTFVKNGEKYEYTANITGLNDTEYNVAIVAKDSFKNISYWSTDASKTTAITGTDTDSVNDIGDSISIDSLAPSSDIKLDSTGKLLDRQKAAVTGASPYSLSFGSTYYTDKTFTLKGTITETNLVENDEQVAKFPGTKKPTLTISKEGVVVDELTLSLGANDGNGKYEWSYTSNYKEDGTDDGLYEYTLTVWDKSRQSFSKSVTITLDTKNPELAFTSPSENESFESDPAAKVAYSDDGVGIKSYSYKLYSISDNGTETEIAIENDAITNGSATGSVNLKKAVGSTEGSYKVTAQVEDSLGHRSELVERKFYFDTSKPAVDEKAVGTSGLTTNAGTITLTGVVYDTNALYQNGAAGTVKISGTWNGKDRTVNATVTPKAETVEGKSYTAKQYATWTYTFNTANKEGVDNTAENYLPDNTYNFAIIATDTAGKTNQISRTVTVDTVAPQFGEEAPSETNTTNVKPHVSTKVSDAGWYKTNSLRFEGTATDVIDGVTGTGIKEVYFETANSTDGGTTWSDWTGKTSFAGTTSWAGTIDKVESKTQKFRVFVEDNAGNKATAVEFGPFNIDMTAPILSSGSVKVNNAEVSEENPFYSRGAKVNEGETVTNPNVTFSVADEENGSGIDKVYVKLYGKVTDAEVTANDSELISVTAGEGNGSCTASIPAAKITKSGTVYARIYDKAGNANDVSLFALTYDATDPKIISPILEEKTANFKAYKTKDANGKEFYYVNNSDGHKFTLSGVATDNLGLSKITLSITDGTTTLDTVEIVDNPATTDKDELADWVFDDIDLHTLSGDNTEATITLYDKAGNKATKDISIVFDTTKPAALHDWDSGSTSKDAVFRIGEDNNDLEELKTWQADHTSLTDADKDVGGKYAPGTYGKANTITVRGYFTEEGSGLQYVYYKVFSQTTPPQESEITAFVNDYKNQKTGFFSAITEETKNVKFNTSDSVYEFKEDVKTNFKSTISEFGIGKNYLVLVGVDYVGNAAVDGIEYTPTGTSTPLNCYSINVDVEAPTVERVLEEGESSTLLTNASGDDPVLKGTAIDNPTGNAAGIKSLSASIKVKERTGTEMEYKTTDTTPQITIESTDNNTKWTVTVKKEIFENVDAGNFNVYVTATDYAGTGNSQTSNVGTISVDKIAPTVTLALPTDADPSTSEREINGVIDLSGTVKDANPLPATAIVGIQYIKKADYTEADDSESAGTKWVTLTKNANGGMTKLELSGDYTFDIKNFDTTKIEPLIDDVYYIRAKAVDKAGNVGYSPIKDSNGKFIEITISQDSDRPVIKLTNLTDLGAGSSPRFVLKYGTKSQVIATVDDDDGIAEVYFSESSYTGTGNAPSKDVSDYSETNGTVTFTPVTANTNAISPDNKNGDGPKGFYIYVKDKADNVFYTMYKTDKYATNYLNVPKVKIGNYHENSADAAQFTYQSDSTSPTVVDIRGLAFKAGASATTAGDVNGGLNNTSKQYTEYEAVNTSYILGGTERQWAQFQVVASDASGIAGIAMEITYTKKDGTKVTKTFSSHNDFKIDANTTVTAADNFKGSGNNATWTTDKVSFADAKSDSVSIKVIPYDKLGLVGNGNVTLMVDNTPPTIKVTSPASGEEKTGSVSFTGTALDDGNAGTEEIFWLIPTTEQVASIAGVTDDTKLSIVKTWSWNGGSSAMPVKASVTSWQFDFDEKYDVATSNTTTHVYKAGNPMLDVYDSDVYAKTITDGVYTLPIYFLAIDKLGNYDIKTDYVILHNPDFDRPKVVFTYPTVSYYDKKAGSTTETEKYVTLGGTIRATGSAEIPSNTTTVKNVYIQIGALNADGTGTFAASKAAAQETMTSYGFSIVDAYTVINAIKGTKYTTSSAFSDGDLRALGFASKTDLDAWWGIQTNGTASWNIPLNADGKMNPPEATGTTTETTKDISIRACGINADGKMGAWTQQDNVIGIHIDNAAPSLSANVEQFASAITSETTTDELKALTPSVSQNYESDMYLRGQWYLVVKALDASDINTLKVNGLDPTYKFAVSESVNGKTKKGYKIFIPIDKSGDSASYKVTAIDSDATSHTAEQTFSFKIDNKAPSLESVTANGAEFSATNIVQNSNYKFTVAGKSTDEGSGVERVVFYYMRKGGVTKDTITDQVILDPMLKPTGENYDAVKVAMNATDIEVLTLTQPSETAGGKASTYDLYARKVSGTATTTTFTVDGSIFDAHVRVGGLITFDGTIFRKITAVSPETNPTAVTFEPALTSAPGSATAYFPIAQVIDNSATEKTSSDSENPFTFEKGDDGDLMPESFSKTSSTWTWDASIHSDNLPDGPISLVIIAFDVAGNVSGTTVNTSVSNNAPRVAKLFLATDLNNNKKFEEEEFEEYSIIGAEGKEKDNYVLDFDARDSKDKKKFSAGKFTAKNKLAVVPEIVGGNKSIMLVAKKEADTTSTATAVPVTDTDATQINSIASGTAVGTTVDETTTYSASLAASGSSAYEVKAPSFGASGKGNKFYAYVLENSVLTGKTAYAEADDGDGKALSFTFWDETEETTQGTNSQKAVVLVKGFTYDLTDGKAPTVVINPFYWQSLNSNSIYGSGDEDNVSSVSDLKGHIELEADWTAKSGNKYITSYDGNASGTALDSDPKVSGKITFTGTAYDEHALSKLTATFGNVLKLNGDNGVEIATYSQNTSSWSVAAATMDEQGYEVTVGDAGKVYSYSNGAQKTTTSVAAAYGVFNDTAYFGQKGHKIYWTLSIDTEKLTAITDKIADKDVALTVKAIDLSNNKTVDSEVPPTISTGYIPGQELSASVTYTVTDGSSNKPAYTVDVVPYITEVKTSLSSLKSSNPSVYTRTALGHYTVRSDETVEFVGFNLGDSASLNISSLSTSGSYDFEVSGIKALNNLNANNSRGAYKSEISDSSSYNVKNNYAYNRQPNNDNNNLLTDDIWFDVWQFNNRAAVPITGKIEQPVMKIRPTDGKIGFAFVNGPLYFSMGGSQSSQNYSYQYWSASYDFFTSVGFTYDDLGNSWGVAAGGDINDSQSDAFTLMSSKFGIGGHDKAASYDGTNSLRLERIGQKLPTDTSYIRKVIQLDAANRTGIWIKPVEGEETATVENGDLLYFCNEDGTLINNTAFRIFGKWPADGSYSNDMLAFQITDPRTNTNQAPATKSLGKSVADYTRQDSGYPQGDRNDSTNIEKDNIYVKIFSMYQGFDKQRIQNPSLVTSTNGTNTNVYLAYYDALNDEIRFKSGTSTKDGKNNFGQFKDSATAAMPNYDATNVSIIAGANEEHKNTGSYLNLGVIPASVTGSKDTVIAVWLDQTTNPALPTLYYAYNNDPITNPGNWTYVGRILPESSNYANAGEYCKVAVDSNGGVHIAAYDSKNLDLVYAYLPASKKGQASSENDFITCVVDSNGVVGSNLTLDVGKDSKTNNIIPYIGYYASSSIKPKMAYYIGGFAPDITTIEAGSNNDSFTGIWECTTIPTASTVEMQSNQHNDINIGLWKSDGVIVASTNGDDSTTNIAGGYNSTSYGQVYGNGSKNAVLGYAIKYGTSDRIETAQMK